ncbi:MAG: S-layer homology domain-containing protein [Oscillospiraceae bacterium]|jgi:hypothetical protein|nr:S-layer homology domain-containing protein [Oscillospiraceae bacterium]
MLKVKGSAIRLLCALLVIVLAVSVIPVPSARAAAIDFSDVTSENFDFAIEKLSRNGILNGYADGTFKPGNLITRAEFSAVIIRALDRVDDALQGETPFSDVPAEHWASGYIRLASELGIVNGVGDGKFEPESNVTYAQVIKMVVGAMGYTQAEADALGGWPEGWLSLGQRANIGLSLRTYERAVTADSIHNAVTRDTTAALVFDGFFQLYMDEQDTTNTGFYFGNYEMYDYEECYTQWVLLPTGVTAYYTVDGTEPTVESHKVLRDEEYGLGRIDLLYSCDLKVFAVNADGKVCNRPETIHFSLPKGDLIIDMIGEFFYDNITDEMTDYEKVLVIHDFIVLSATYSQNTDVNGDYPDINYTIYGLLVDGEGVCQAYARAMELMLAFADVDAYFVVGEANGGADWGSHAWLIVKVDGEYYHVDPTFDDPTPDYGTVDYHYFLVSDSTMLRDHRWGLDIYPACDSDYPVGAAIKYGQS